MIGGVNVSPADTGGVYALLNVLGTRRRPRQRSTRSMRSVEANEKALVALREEREKADRALDAAEVAQKVAVQLRDEAEKMRTAAVAEAAETRANLTRQEVALGGARGRPRQEGP